MRARPGRSTISCFPPRRQARLAAPSEEALKTFFNDRKSSYRAPEFRAMDVLALEPETIANPAEVSDADAEAAYAKIAGKDPRFGAPEKRDLQQILFPNEADASAAEAKLKAGASFDDLIKERGLKPEDTDLGETTKDAMLDKAEADAVFALPQGGVSEVLKSQFGPVIVRVKGITPSTMKPFARGRGRGQAPGLGFARRRQDPGAPRQDRGPPGVGQIPHRSRQGGRIDRAIDRRPSTPRALTPRARP